MSIMDFEKVNLELIEALLEWIVDGKHSYPPGNHLLSSFVCNMAKKKAARLLRQWVLWGQPPFLDPLLPPSLFHT